MHVPLRSSAPHLPVVLQQSRPVCDCGVCPHCVDSDFEVVEEEVEVPEATKVTKVTKAAKAEDEKGNEGVIRMTEEILQRHLGLGLGEVPFFPKSGKRRRGHGALSKTSLSWKPSRRGRRNPFLLLQERHKAGRRGKARYTDLHDGKRMLTQVPVKDILFSQESCKSTFQSGLPISELVHDLMVGKVNVGAPFLCLTVFETSDGALKSKDNRRLLALKEFARFTNQPNLMVNISLYSHATVLEVLRFIQNSDSTSGFSIRVRKNDFT